MSDDESIQIDRLSAEQRSQLETYLRGAQIPFEMSATDITVGAHHVDDLYTVLKIVGNAPDADSADVLIDDDPNDWSVSPLSPRKRKAVFGRAYATSNQRAIGGMIDWIILLLVPVVTVKSGAANWAIVAGLAIYTVVATTVFGRTIGKLVAGTKVIEANGRRRPNLASSLVRWFVVSWSAILGLFANTLPIGVVVGVFIALAITFAPILWDESGQGWHDRLADTVVVQVRD